MYHIIQTQMCIELKVFIESIFVEEYNLGFNLQLNLIWLISQPTRIYHVLLLWYATSERLYISKENNTWNIFKAHY